MQYFGSFRVVDYQAWGRAVDGHVVRLMRWVGDEGRFEQWVGRPDSFERSLGVPDVTHATDSTVAAFIDAQTDEETVLTIAGRWSVNPETLEGRTAAGKLLVADLRPA